MCQRSGEIWSARMAKISRSPEEEDARRERQRGLAQERARCRQANPDVHAREIEFKHLCQEANQEACAKCRNALAWRRGLSASLFRQCSRSGASLCAAGTTPRTLSPTSAEPGVSREHLFSGVCARFPHTHFTLSTLFEKTK